MHDLRGGQTVIFVGPTWICLPSYEGNKVRSKLHFNQGNYAQIPADVQRLQGIGSMGKGVDSEAATGRHRQTCSILVKYRGDHSLSPTSLETFVDGGLIHRFSNIEAPSGCFSTV